MKTCPECGREWPDEAQFCGVDATRLVDTSESEAEELIVGHYRILEKLGAGGMGAVYTGEHLSLGRRDAIKMLNRSFAADPDALARFHREAKNASTIHHENVCLVYDFGETPEGLSFLAMELVDGTSLEELLEREGGSIEPGRATGIVRQVAAGLQAAHEKNIVHRDLKPGNVMIAARPDGSDSIKVVDFGIAKAVDKSADQQITRIGLVAGTREYMSPEHLRGDEADPRSDIYALGVVLFRTITGEFPFTTEHPGPKPRRLREARPDVVFPPGLQAIIDRSLAHDPKLRFESAKAFGQALVDAVHSPVPKTVTSEPPDVAKGNGKRRMRPAVLAAAGTMAAVAAVVVWSVATSNGEGQLVLYRTALDLPAGESATLRAGLMSAPDDTVPVTSGVAWTTSDSSAASIDDAGIITGGRVAGGETDATARVGDETVRLRVRVIAGPPAQIALSGPKRFRSGDGAEFQVDEVSDSFGNTIENPEISWRSEDMSVFRVDPDGRGEAQGPGSTNLQVAVTTPAGQLTGELGVTVAGSSSSGTGGEPVEPIDPGGPDAADARAEEALRPLCVEVSELREDEAWARRALAVAEPLWRDPTLPRRIRAAAAEVVSHAYAVIASPHFQPGAVNQSAAFLAADNIAVEADEFTGGMSVDACAPLMGGGA